MPGSGRWESEELSRSCLVRPGSERASEVREELGGHCAEADAHLNKAVDFLMDCIDRQERAIKDAGEEPDRHGPELKSMYS